MIKKMIHNTIKIEKNNFPFLEEKLLFTPLFIYNIKQVKYFLSFYYFITIIISIIKENAFRQNKQTLKQSSIQAFILFIPLLIIQSLENKQHIYDINLCMLSLAPQKHASKTQQQHNAAQLHEKQNWLAHLENKN